MPAKASISTKGNPTCLAGVFGECFLKSVCNKSSIEMSKYLDISTRLSRSGRETPVS